MENGSDRTAQVLFSFQINTFTLTSETPALLTADDAVLVLQASHGQVDRMSSLGDPTLVFPPPTDQWSQAYYFAVPDLAGDQRKKKAKITPNKPRNTPVCSLSTHRVSRAMSQPNC